jgi:succinyl-CoA---D-citramalate CoA-transferase
MRVLEFGDNAAAGYCGRLFQLFGAEVIRVDLPGAQPANDRELALDIYLHTGKKRSAIDYLTADGEALLHTLAGESDIVVTDLVPLQLDQLNWSSFPAGLRVSISPFGLTGPYREWQGSGAILLAMGGYTFLMGDEDKAPLSLPINYVEYQSAQFAYTAALASHAFANDCRDIEVSMLETVLSLSQFTTVMWTCQKRIRSRHGNRFQNVYPVSLYSCKDGCVYINVLPNFWPALVALIGDESLLTDERFLTNQKREENQVELDAIINSAFSGYTMAELLELGQRKYRFPIGSAMTLQQVLDDGHLKARYYWHDIEIPGRQTIKAPGSAIRSVPLSPQAGQTWEGIDG